MIEQLKYGLHRLRRKVRGRAYRANRALMEREIAQGVVDVASHPLDLQFSSEHRCNLRCVMCYSTVARNQGQVPLMDRKLPERTAERFRKLEHVLPHAREVSLTGSGEPLLSPALPELLEILRGHRHPEVEMNTHAGFLDRERAEMIVQSGLYKLIISMDGATKETHERIRVNSKWDKVLENIDTLLRVKRERKSALPVICYAGNFMRSNIEELPDLVDFAASHGGSMVLATNTVVYDPSMEQEALVHHPELTRAMVLEARARAKRLGIAFDNQVLDAEALDGAEAPPPAVEQPAPEPEPEPGPEAASVAEPSDAPRILEVCRMPWEGLMVESDGSVKNCCFNGPYIGNLNEQSFEEVWNGEPVQELRRSFVEDRPPEGCLNCFIFLKSRKREAFYDPIAGGPFCLEAPEDGACLQGEVTLSGWALDRSGVDRVEVRVDGTGIGLASYGLPRPDVTASYRRLDSSGRNGFQFGWDTTAVRDGQYQLSVAVTNGKGETVERGSRTVLVENGAGAGV